MPEIKVTNNVATTASDQLSGDILVVNDMKVITGEDTYTDEMNVTTKYKDMTLTELNALKDFLEDKDTLKYNGLVAYINSL